MFAHWHTKRLKIREREEAKMKERESFSFIGSLKFFDLVSTVSRDKIIKFELV